MKRAAHIALVLTIVIGGVAMPLSAHADTYGVSVQTAQILPVGGNSCAPLVVNSVQPYIYSDSLHSFDVTIADASYVAVIASVGNVSVPYNLLTYFNNSDGSVRIHVDIPTTPIYGSAPVAMTLLSSPTGQPTCLSSIAFSVLGNAQHTYPTPTYPSTTGGSHETPSTPAAPATTSPATSTPVQSTSTPVSGAVTGMTLAERVHKACEGSGALQLWFLLITLFLLSTATVALAEPPLYKKKEWLPGALIAGPFAVLVAVWFFVPVCRGAGWMPLMLLAIAIVGTLIAYREDRKLNITRIFQLPPTPTIPVSRRVAEQIADKFEEKKRK